MNPFLRLGYGIQFDSDLWDSGDTEVYIMNAGVVTGRKKHHFECGSGIVNDFIKNETYRNFLQASSFMGYRIQNFRSNSPFVFRTGLGYPETVYVGLGLSF